MRIVDLTHTLSTHMPVYPGKDQPGIMSVANISANGYNELMLSFSNHTGTHVDCPAHFMENHYTTDNVPIDRFAGKAICIDCSHLREGELIDENVLGNVDLRYGRYEFVLFYTGWSYFWGKPEYFGHFPVLAQPLLDELIGMNIKGIGFDTISADPIDATNFINHIKILGNNILIVENLAHLDKVADREFIFTCFPLKIENGDASPVRATAIFL